MHPRSTGGRGKGGRTDLPPNQGREREDRAELLLPHSSRSLQGSGEAPGSLGDLPSSRPRPQHPSLPNHVAYSQRHKAPATRATHTSRSIPEAAGARGTVGWGWSQLHITAPISLLRPLPTLPISWCPCSPASCVQAHDRFGRAGRAAA